MLLAEVKTGDFAPSLHTAATRRQLLEYATALGHDEILLVDAYAESIKRVTFVPNKKNEWQEKALDFSKTFFSAPETREYWTLF